MSNNAELSGSVRYLVFVLCFSVVFLVFSPARHCRAEESPPASVDAQDGEFVGGSAQDAAPVTVDLSPIVAAQQEVIDGQGELLAVLKSCNTLLLSLALFELFRFARGMSKRVFKKGVSNG